MSGNERSRDCGRRRVLLARHGRRLVSDRVLFIQYADAIHNALMNGRRRLEPDNYRDLLAYVARLVAEESTRLLAEAWEREDA